MSQFFSCFSQFRGKMDQPFPSKTFPASELVVQVPPLVAQLLHCVVIRQASSAVELEEELPANAIKMMVKVIMVLVRITGMYQEVGLSSAGSSSLATQEGHPQALCRLRRVIFISIYFIFCILFIKSKKEIWRLHIVTCILNFLVLPTSHDDLWWWCL